MAKTQNQLEELHEALADTIKSALDQAAADGEMPSASILNVARQFLNDNGIEAKPGTGSPADKVGRSLESLPFPDSDSAVPGEEASKH